MFSCWKRYKNIKRVVVYIRAGQGGQSLLVDRYKRLSLLESTNLVLVEDSFYGTRLTDNVISYKRKKKTKVSVLGHNTRAI